VERSLILETTFLIDLEREIARRQEGPAQAFLAARATQSFFITPTISGELAAGASLDDRSRWEDFVAPFQVLPCTRDVCWEYGRAYRYLQENGLLIGSNDLWIAATALAHQAAVVTRNVKHYRRVPGLSVAEYR
jgi:tRNA(fMet)-specific endonuclease VapC